MSVAFWSATVTVGKPFTVQPLEGYVLNLQQAAMVNCEAKSSVVLRAQSISIEGEKMNAILGTLRPITQDQFSMGKLQWKRSSMKQQADSFAKHFIMPNMLNSLGMVFGHDVPVTFSVETSCKNATVHLSGYYQPGPDEDQESDDEDDDGKNPFLFVDEVMKCYVQVKSSSYYSPPTPTASFLNFPKRKVTAKACPRQCTKNS